ncbi:MAG: DUF4160 domain-containing protein [Bdellovibrio sp.]|nr:DUF4160 domain-containing protein [Bdellovibrio sp.]
MPEISRFFGIVVTIFYNDHAPPHFHVRYNDFRAKLSIADLNVIEGQLPKRVLTLVLEWAFEHRAELMEDWVLAMKKKQLKPISPLE